jgi:predicted lipoprotein
MRVLALAIGLTIAATSLAKADLAARGNHAVEGWQEAASSFDAATAKACPPGAPADEKGLEEARDAFRTLAIRWQEARPWMVGPAAPSDLSSKVWFWPDPHGSATRQIGKAISSGKAEGVASTGLGLAELVLFGDDAITTQACGALREVGRTQKAIAEEIAPTFVATRLNPVDRQRLLFVSMRDTLDRVSQEKVARPLGLDLDTARGQRAEGWRSGMSLGLIDAALKAVEAIYLPPDGVAVRLQNVEGGSQLDQTLRDQFAKTHAAVTAVKLPLDEAVSDPTARPGVEAMLREVQQLRLLVVERLAPAVGETLGFNALDGD